MQVWCGSERTFRFWSSRSSFRAKCKGSSSGWTSTATASSTGKTRNPKPWTRFPRPETRNPETETRNTDPPSLSPFLPLPRTSPASQTPAAFLVLSCTCLPREVGRHGSTYFGACEVRCGRWLFGKKIPTSLTLRRRDAPVSAKGARAGATHQLRSLAVQNTGCFDNRHANLAELDANRKQAFFAGQVPVSAYGGSQTYMKRVLI